MNGTVTPGNSLTSTEEEARRARFRTVADTRDRLANLIVTAMLAGTDPVMYAGHLREYRTVTETYDRLALELFG